MATRICVTISPFSARVFHFQPYHKFNIYTQRSLRMDRKLYPYLYNRDPIHPQCPGCECQLVPMQDRRGAQKIVTVDDTMLVKDHPYTAFRNFRNQDEKMSAIVVCDQVGCSKHGVGSYAMFKPCVNCKDETEISYRIGGCRSSGGRRRPVHLCIPCSKRVLGVLHANNPIHTHTHTHTNSLTTTHTHTNTPPHTTQN